MLLRNVVDVDDDDDAINNGNRRRERNDEVTDDQRNTAIATAVTNQATASTWNSAPNQTTFKAGHLKKCGIAVDKITSYTSDPVYTEFLGPAGKYVRCGLIEFLDGTNDRKKQMVQRKIYDAL